MSDSIANGGCCSGSVRPGTYGNAASVAQVTVDKCGRITKVSNVLISISNISSNAITQPFANLVVSNSVTTTNIFALSANILFANIANIYTTNIVGFIGSQWTSENGNVYYLGGVGIGTNNVTSNLTVAGNVYASDSVTTTNVFATSINVYGTSNLTSVTAQDLIVTSTLDFTG